MHTYVHDLSGTTFNFNSDMSGDVHIFDGRKHFTVDGAALLALAAEYVRRERIRAAEGATIHQLLFRMQEGGL